jgi:hypothetical protein
MATRAVVVDVVVDAGVWLCKERAANQAQA